MKAIERIKAEKIYTFQNDKLVLIANNYKELEAYITNHFGKESRKYECYSEAVNYYNVWEWYGGLSSDLYHLDFFVNPNEDNRMIMELNRKKAGGA